MEILVTGRLSSISSSFFDKLLAQHKIIVSSDGGNKNIIGDVHKFFPQPASQQSFTKLFSTYSFDYVIFFIGRPDEEEYFGQLRELELTLKMCAHYDVSKVIVISSTYVYQGSTKVNEKTVLSPADPESVELFSCEKLCEIYRNEELSILILRVPCLFGLYESGSLIGSLVQQLASKNSAHINGAENQTIDFLSQEDLGELVSRILQDWRDDITSINVPGARQLSLAELSVSLRRVIQTTRITFSDRPAPIYAPVYSNIPKKEFDWVPVIGIEDEIPNLIENINKKTDTFFQRVKKRIAEGIGSRSSVVKIIELALGYVIMELLNRYTTTTAQFRFIDFRLLFIVLMGTVHGLSTAFTAAVLAAISLTVGFLTDGSDWRVLVYNIENWLPYACYFVIGAIAGYTKDKHTNDYDVLTDEKNELEKRYKFLDEIYNSSLQNKKQFKKQIISYRDSFGRIFEVIKKLDNVLPDAIFKEALLSLEDILQNHTISIYSFQKGSTFGRLRVCSKKIIESAPKSLDLTKFDPIMLTVKKNEVWRNKDCIHNYPDYTFPIFRDDNLELLIIIDKASYEQMAVYFENLFKIVCNLIEASLLRAQQYNEKFADEFYLPGTRILKKEVFKDVLRVRTQMEEVAISEYALISVEATTENMKYVAEQLQNYLRESDVIGESGNGNLYIILSQASEEDIPLILKRLRRAGLSFTQLNEDTTAKPEPSSFT